MGRDLDNSAPSSLCLEFQSANPSICQECASGYTLLLFNSTSTICAQSASVSTQTGSSTQCSIDSTYYPYEAALTLTLSAIFSYFQRSSSLQPSYCFSCQVYFYDVPTQSSKCSTCDYSSLTGDNSLHSIYSQSIGCLSCPATGYENSVVSYRSEVDIYVRDCLQSQTQSCQFTEYYDSASSSCLKCDSLFPNCAACDSTKCNVCYQYFYWHSSAYNPQTNSRQGMCLFEACPQGYCKDEIRNACVASTLSNCLACNQDSSTSTVVQNCKLCQKGYLPSTQTGGTSCKALSGSATWNYFVKAGAPILLSEDIYNPATNDGSSPSLAFLMIQEAINAIHKKQQANYLQSVTANVYLGAGSHFFIQCNGDEATFATTTYSSNFINYCTKLNLYKETILSDMITINFAPLQCKQAALLGLSSVEVNFKAMCIDILIDDKPMIYVTKSSTYFNITGSMTFDNLRFSGINAFARPTSTSVDLSILPTLLCDNINDISYGESLLTFQKMSTYDYVNNNVAYKCSDAWYSGSSIPSTYTKGVKCKQNSNQMFSSHSESTLSCGLDPNDEAFFYLRPGSSVYSKRQATLFNLYAFPEYLTAWAQPPSIKITNCAFQYFMGNYSSLINVENNNLRRVLKTAPVVMYGQVVQTTRHFYTYSGGARGAKVEIRNSAFSESRFCYGLIVHRKQMYMPYVSSMLNYTQLYLETSMIDDSGSYILIKDSKFINLNYLTNVTALAIYNGYTATESLQGLNSLENMTYQATIHKGIVLNVKDFNGQIEIAGSTFKLNMHFIPEVLVYPFTTGAVDSIDHFQDEFYTQEYKLAICNTDTLQDSFMFQDGVNANDDLDEYFMKFERLGLLYISRNKRPILVRGNTFSENIGSFGAAITINSPDWQTSSPSDLGPLIVISDNKFDKNFAYFSGGAIYIMNTLVPSNIDRFCGGIHISNNQFTNNTGMKIHNAGAIGVLCHQIQEEGYEDYLHTSSLPFSDPTGTLTTTVKSKLDSDVSFKVLTTQLTVTGCNFTENYSGLKGTALYLRQLHRMNIRNSTFLRNGPVFSLIDRVVSPYARYFTAQSYSIVFRDPSGVCSHEFNYIDKCAKSGYSIDWPQVRGTVHVIHCNDAICMTKDNVQQLLIEKCDFQSNSAGPLLDSAMPYDLAQSLYISNGFNNSIRDTTFRDHAGISQLNITNASTRLAAYFPSNYFTYGNAAVIRIMQKPVYLSGSEIFDYVTLLRNVSFLRNFHAQVLGQNFILQYYGSLISFETGYMLGIPFAPQMQLDSCVFRENSFMGNETSLIFMFKGLLSVTNSLAYGNGYLSKSTASKAKDQQTASSYYFPFQSYNFFKYQVYGLFYLMGVEQFPSGYIHNFTNNTFRFNFAYQGAVYSYKIDSQYSLMQSNTYKYHVVTKQGGVAYVRSQDGRTTLMFVNESAEFMFAKTQGAISAEPHDPGYVSIFILNSTFKNNNAQQGQSVFMDSPAAVLIQNCSFYNDLWPSNKTAYLESKFKAQTLALQQFIDYKYLYTLVDTIVPEGGGAIYIEQNFNDKPVYFGTKTLRALSDPYLMYAQILDCNFQSLSAQSGAAFMGGKMSHILIANLNFQDPLRISTIKNNTVSMYGAIFSQNSFSFLMENLVVEQNVAVTKGSGYGSQDSNVSISNCTFKQNTAGDKGTLYLFEDNNFTCTDCKILGNWAKDSSAIFGINNINGYLLFVNNVVSGNQAVSSTATFILSQVTFLDSAFVDNTAQQVNHGVTLITANFWASNITVNYTLPAFLRDTSDNVDSGFFNVNYQSSLVVANSSRFQNCRGAIASVIFATGFSSVTLKNNVTISSSASFSGSTLFLSLTNLAEIHDTVFYNNTQSDITVQSVNLNISRSYFTLGHNQLIYATLSNVTIRSSTFENGLNYDIQGKGLYCQCDNLKVENSLFQHLIAVEGGAIYFTSSKPTSNLTLTNNTFFMNEAMQGGALAVNDAWRMNISGNKFVQNQAFLFEDPTTKSGKLVQKGVGGAIKLDCFNENVKLVDNCNYWLGNKNQFTFNSATDDGGAVQWYSNPYTDDGTNNFTSNSALYADNVGSYAKEIAFAYISNGDYLNPINNPSPLDSNSTLRRLNGNEDYLLRIPLDRQERAKRNLSSVSFTLDGAVSGTPLQFVAYVLDMEGNLYKSDNSSLATLRSLTKGIIIQNFEVNAHEGVYNFSKFTVNLQPGSSALFTFSIQNFQTYSNSISFIADFPSVTVNSRKCAPGEQYTTDMRCIKCKAGYYLYEAPSSVTACVVCQDEAVCFGLNVVAPKPGYWRSSNSSSNFIQCPNKDACLGGDIQNLLGKCAQGYTGTACGNCIAGFKKNLDFRCSKCPNQATNSIQFIGFLVVSTIICIILVRSNILSVEKKRPLHTVYMKMMTNHFQILSAILAIDYNWPNVIQELQNGQLQLASFADEIFSFDCFLQSNGLVDESDKIFMQKLIFYAFLPLILAAVSVAVWYSIGYLQGNFRFKDRLVGTVVVLLFLIHTSIAKTLFSAFNCLPLDGKLKLKDNVEMECYTDRHLVYVMAIVVPALLVWIFGIPFLALVVMIRNKTQIQHMRKFHELSKYDQTKIRSIKVRIGFLLHGFTDSKYYWEILIIYRKVLIVMVIVLLNPSSVEAQVLVVMMLLILSVLLHLHYNPYYSEVLNRMELYSLLTACVTMYGGMFYVTGKHYAYMKPKQLGWAFLVLILLPNLLFLLYWGVHMRVELLKLLFQNYPRAFKYLTCNYYAERDFEKIYMSEQTTNPTQGDLPRGPKSYLEEEIGKQENEGRNPFTNPEEQVDDFSNVIVKRFQEAQSKQRMNEDRSSIVSEIEDFNLQRKLDNLDFKLKGGGPPLFGSSDVEDDTGDSKNKSVSSKDVGIAFQPHMLKRIVQPDSPRGERGPSHYKSQQKRDYNRLTDNSPITTRRRHGDSSRRQHQLESLQGKRPSINQLLEEKVASQQRNNLFNTLGAKNGSRFESSVLNQNEEQTVRTQNAQSERATDRSQVDVELLRGQRQRAAKNSHRSLNRERGSKHHRKQESLFSSTFMLEEDRKERHNEKAVKKVRRNHEQDPEDHEDFQKLRDLIGMTHNENREDDIQGKTEEELQREQSFEMTLMAKNVKPQKNSRERAHRGKSLERKKKRFLEMEM